MLTHIWQSPARKPPSPRRPAPQVGDKVKPGRSVLTYEISKVHHGSNEVDLHVPEPTCSASASASKTSPPSNENLQREPPTPFTNPEPMPETGEVLERIATVKDENLKRLHDDIDILKAYLKTQHAPQAAISALEGLTVEQ